MKTTQVIIEPYITEKGTLGQEHNKYIVRVARDTNKVAIKQAIKQLYGVDVEKVNIMNSPRKTRLVRRGKEMTKRPLMKKAVVTIKKGQKFDISKVKESK